MSPLLGRFVPSFKRCWRFSIVSKQKHLSMKMFVLPKSLDFLLLFFSLTESSLHCSGLLTFISWHVSRLIWFSNPSFNEKVELFAFLLGFILWLEQSRQKLFKYFLFICNPSQSTYCGKIWIYLKISPTFLLMFSYIPSKLCFLSWRLFSLNFKIF